MTNRSNTQTCTQVHRRAQPSILSLIMQTLGLARQRRSLADLDPHMLRDIGITPEEAHAEATKPVWDVPRHWRQ